MAKVRSLCVYCGASSQVDAIYRDAAAETGRLLARAGIEVVFGGGRVGLMGILADAALAEGGRVTGIIPQHLDDREVGHRGLTELIVVPSMHVRKQLMADRSDGFLALPGGLGTLDETFEMITWKQIGLHDKPIVMLDVEGYWGPFHALYRHVVESGFAPASAKALYTTVDDLGALLETLAALPEPRIGTRTALA
jgi:uncharacterized protein (TIGR00730 family)